MEKAQEILTYFSGPAGYALFFLLVMACGCGFPFNSDITLITAAVLSANGIFQLWIVMILAILAILTGDSICFLTAKKWGISLLQIRPFRWIFKKKGIEKASRLLNEHGKKFLFTVRFLPLIRTALFFTAGTLKVPTRSFYLMNGLATIIYVPVLMVSSYQLSRNIDLIFDGLKRFQFVLLSIVLFFVYRIYSRKRARN